MVQQDETPDGEEITILRVYFPELEEEVDGTLYDDGVRILMDPYDKKSHRPTLEYLRHIDQLRSRIS